MPTVKIGDRYLTAQLVTWPSFCGGRMLCDFYLRGTISRWESVLGEFVSASDAAKRLVEAGCVTGSVAIADRKGGVGSAHIIDALPRQWTSKETGFTYYVTKSPVYKNSTHNSDVHHAIVWRKARVVKKKVAKKKNTKPIIATTVLPKAEMA